MTVVGDVGSVERISGTWSTWHLNRLPVFVDVTNLAQGSPRCLTSRSNPSPLENQKGMTRPPECSIVIVDDTKVGTSNGSNMVWLRRVGNGVEIHQEDTVFSDGFVFRNDVYRRVVLYFKRFGKFFKTLKVRLPMIDLVLKPYLQEILEHLATWSSRCVNSSSVLSVTSSPSESRYETATRSRGMSKSSLIRVERTLHVGRSGKARRRVTPNLLLSLNSVAAMANVKVDAVCS